MGAQVAAVKRCSKCGVIKDSALFSRNAQRRDGLASQCNPCANALKGARRAQERAKPKRAKTPPPPLDPVALREFLFIWRPEAEGLREPELRNLEEVLWGLICDDDHPQYRAAYACARGENG